MTDRRLLTVEMTAGELRVVRAAAKCRGTTMSGLIRRLLREQLIDLER
jgi:hypothetical protein